MKKNCKGWNQHQNGIFLFCRVKPSGVDNLFIRLNGKTWLEAKNWLTLSSWRHRRINAFSKLYNSQHWALTFFLWIHSMRMAGATLSSWRNQRIYVFSNSQIIQHQKVLALEPIFIGSLQGEHSLTSIQAILVFALASWIELIWLFTSQLTVSWTHG